LEMVYSNDPFWHDPTLLVYDPRTFAWVDEERRAELEPNLSGRPSWPSERVRVTYPSPQRAELTATLESAGLVVLADVAYPGWELTIDGKPAPIYRVNRLMRGAAVPAGTHHLIFRYAPMSLAAGRLISVIGLGALVVLGIYCAARPTDPVLGDLGKH